ARRPVPRDETNARPDPWRRAFCFLSERKPRRARGEKLFRAPARGGRIDIDPARVGVDLRGVKAALLGEPRDTLGKRDPAFAVQRIERVNEPWDDSKNPGIDGVEFAKLFSDRLNR